MTTVTRRLFAPDRRGPLLEMMHAYRTQGGQAAAVLPVVAMYDVDYESEPAPYELINAHVELGGEAMAMRNGLMYERFGDQSPMAWPELWPDCTFHIVFATRRVWERDGLNGLIPWITWHEANPCTA